MIQDLKLVIFDLDDTLIPWQDKYMEAVTEAIKYYCLPCTPNEMNNIFRICEATYHHYDINLILELIKRILGITVSKDFLDLWFYRLGFMSEENSEAIEILEYLYPKYELAVLTNCFEFIQSQRLAVAKMLPYFKRVVGGDTYIKPDPRAFELAIGTYSPEVCLMIGDNYEIDYLAAKNVGLRAIHLSEDEKSKAHARIRSLKDLKNIL